MTGSDVVRAFSSAALALIPFGAVLKRKLQSRFGDGDRKWRNGQAARFESLKRRMKAQEDFATVRYPDLPNVHLAGLLAAPRDQYPNYSQQPKSLPDSAVGAAGVGSCARKPAIPQDLHESRL
jgi:hypothetical protein